MTEPQRPGLFISVDVETRGPVPSRYDMIQLGAVAMLDTGELVDEFRCNIKSVRGGEPATMDWWSKHKEQYDATFNDNEDLATAIRFYDRWVRKTAARVWGPDYEQEGLIPTLVAWPANFDWQFINDAFVQANRPNPHGYACIDIRSMLNGYLGYGGRYSHDPDVPDWMTEGLEYVPYQHDALADARYQADQFGRLLGRMRDCDTRTTFRDNRVIADVRAELFRDRTFVREQVNALRAKVGLPPGHPDDTISGWWAELHREVERLRLATAELQSRMVNVGSIAACRAAEMRKSTAYLRGGGGHPDAQAERFARADALHVAADYLEELVRIANGAA